MDKNQKPRYKFFKVKEHLFLFKYDADDPEQLHIVVRHMASVSDTLSAFFNGKTDYQAQHKRYRTESEDYFVLWFWLNEAEKKVMIISAGPLDGGFYRTMEDN